MRETVEKYEFGKNKKDKFDAPFEKRKEENET